MSLLLLYVSLICFWSDSEIWAVSSSSQLFERYHAFAFGMKPVFNFILYISWKISRLVGVLPMTSARFIFGLNAIWIVYLTWKLTWSMTKSRTLALASAAILSSSVFFVEQGFRVRSDLAATTCLLLSMQIFASRAELKRRDLIGFFSLMVLSFAMTPNAVIAIFAYFPFVLICILKGYFHTNEFDRKQLVKLARVILPVIVCAFSALIYFRSGIEASLDFFVETFSTKSVGFPYWSHVRFSYLEKFAKYDSIFATFIILNLFFSVGLMIRHCWLSYRTSQVISLDSSSGTQVDSFLLSSSVLAILLFLHPSKLPFLIGSYLPFFACAIAVAAFRLNGLFRFFQTPALRSILRFAFAGVIIFQISHVMFAASKMNAEHTNSEQARVMKYLNGYLSTFDRPTYYDVIGILPDYPPTNYFVGPGQLEANRAAVQGVKDSNFDFVFATEKLRSVGQSLAFYLRKNYIEVTKGVFTRAVDIDLPQMRGFEKNSISGASFHELIQQQVQKMGVTSVRYRFEVLSKDMRVITEQVVIRNGGLFPVRLTENLGDIDYDSPHIRVYFPQDFWRLRVTPYGAPILPTEKTLGELFRFDTEL